MNATFFSEFMCILISPLKTKPKRTKKQMIQSPALQSEAEINHPFLTNAGDLFSHQQNDCSGLPISTNVNEGRAA